MLGSARWSKGRSGSSSKNGKSKGLFGRSESASSAGSTSSNNDGGTGSMRDTSARLRARRSARLSDVSAVSSSSGGECPVDIIWETNEIFKAGGEKEEKVPLPPPPASLADPINVDVPPPPPSPSPETFTAPPPGPPPSKAIFKRATSMRVAVPVLPSRGTADDDKTDLEPSPAFVAYNHPVNTEKGDKDCPGSDGDANRAVLAVVNAAITNALCSVVNSVNGIPAAPSHVAAEEEGVTEATALALCENCGEVPPLFYCSDCEESLCAACDSVIHKGKKRSGHTRVDISNVHANEVVETLVAADRDDETKVKDAPSRNLIDGAGEDTWDIHEAPNGAKYRFNSKTGESEWILDGGTENAGEENIPGHPTESPADRDSSSDGSPDSGAENIAGVHIYESENGHKFLFDPDTGKSTWMSDEYADWSSRVDEATECVYYFNSKTNDTSWTLPFSVDASIATQHATTLEEPQPKVKPRYESIRSRRGSRIRLRRYSAPDEELLNESFQRGISVVKEASDWKIVQDAGEGRTQRNYFYNARTQESQWTTPAALKRTESILNRRGTKYFQRLRKCQKSSIDMRGFDVMSALDSITRTRGMTVDTGQPSPLRSNIWSAGDNSEAGSDDANSAVNDNGDNSSVRHWFGKEFYIFETCLWECGR